MTLSITDANAKLSGVNSFSELIDLINQLDAKGTGFHTVLYSGKLGAEFDTKAVTLALADLDPSLRALEDC